MGLEAGVNPSVIAMSTKHKTPKSLLTYADASPASLAAGSLQVAKRLRRDDPNFICGESIATSENAVISSSSSSSQMISAAASTEFLGTSINQVMGLSTSSSQSTTTTTTKNVTNKSYTFHFN